MNCEGLTSGLWPHPIVLDTRKINPSLFVASQAMPGVNRDAEYSEIKVKAPGPRYIHIKPYILEC